MRLILMALLIILTGREGGIDNHVAEESLILKYVTEEGLSIQKAIDLLLELPPEEIIPEIELWDIEDKKLKDNLITYFEKSIFKVFPETPEIASEIPRVITQQVPQMPVPEEPQRPIKTVLKLDSFYNQRKNFQNGCELIALINSIRCLGAEISETEIYYVLANFFEMVPFYWSGGKMYGPDPAVAYAGNPSSSGGFYSFEGVSERAGNKLLANMKKKMKMKNINGANLEEIKDYIADGKPVVFWALLNFGSSVRYCNTGWYINETEYYVPYSNLHCMTVIGYDDENETFKICDSLSDALYWIPYKTFLESATALGNRYLTFEETT